MRNHLPQLKPGAQRVVTVEVDEGNDRDAIALYRNADGEMTLLIDSFRAGDWDSVLLRPTSTEALRKLLNKVHRERETE